jgi:putative membrane protein
MKGISKMNKKDNIGNEQAEAPDLKSKSRLLTFILGIFIGLAVIVPGVSGSTIAIIFGLYTAMLYAMGNIFNDFKRCVIFLIPLALGAVVGFAAGFIVIQKIFGKYLFSIVCLFVGLMVGALPAITQEIKGQKLSAVRSTLFPLGLIIPIAIGILSIILTGNADTSDTATFTSFPIWRYILYLPLGFIVSITQIVPGLSATAILMAFGQFGPILNSVSVSYILENPQVLGLYASLGIGFVAGIVLISRLFSAILAKHKVTAFFMITGMSIGSIISMFINPDVYEVYVGWANGNGNPVLSIIVGVVLLAIGFVLSFLLTRYELKHNKN